MALKRRYSEETPIIIRATLRHNGDTDIEDIQNWINQKITGFKQNAQEDGIDPWILENLTLEEDRENFLLTKRE